MSLRSGYARNFVAPIAEVLPSHAHVVETERSWQAVWSTPDRVWTIRFRDPQMEISSVEVEAEGAKFTVRSPGSQTVKLILALLDTYKALPGDVVNDPD